MSVAPPQILEHPLYDTTFPSTVVINVKVSGHPTPSYQWFRNGVRILNDTVFNVPSNGSLLVNGSPLTDGDCFLFIAKNTAGTAVMSFNFTFMPPLPGKLIN